MTRIAILALLLLLPAGASAGKGQGAFWRSLLVPGWGQRYATGGGGRFFAAELAFWGGYLGFERLREVRRDQYRAFAAAHADARPQGKDGEYFDDLETRSIDEREAAHLSKLPSQISNIKFSS